jgi:hypothetical protein
MSMPDSVKFMGQSDEGPFRGSYNPQTGEITADVAYGAHSLGGIVDVGKAPYSFHMTGRKTNGQVSAESNGQPLQIVNPPEIDEKKP